MPNPELWFWLKVLRVVFAFTLIIGVHEFGHALCAWLCGAKIKSFSIGFGPGVTFRKVPMVNNLKIGPILLGGYVMLEDKALDDKNFWQKMLFYSAGMIVNVLTATFILACLGQNVFGALTQCTAGWLLGWPGLIWQLFSHQMSGAEFSDGAAGPVGIAQLLISKKYNYFKVLAVLNVAVAMFNLLPIPPLDGGRMLQLVTEKIIGKKWTTRIFTAATIVGILALYGFAIWVTTNDIGKIMHPKH